MATIDIGHGLITLVDDDDVSRLAEAGPWHTGKHLRTQYVWHTGPGGKALLMHRFLMGAQDGQQVDHVNSDGLDNRKENLRLCSVSQNQAN